MKNLIYLTSEEFQNRKESICEANSVTAHFEQIQPLYKEVQKVLPDATLYYCISSSANYPIYCRMNVGVVRNGVTFIMQRNYKDKKCYFEVITSMFPEAESSILYKLKEKYPEPCKIGVFTKRKVEDWITRGLNIYKELEAENAVLQQIKAEYLATLKNEKIDWKNTAHTEGSITRNGLRFSFRFIGRSIYETTELANTYASRTYSAFVKLADNRY